VSQPAAEHPSPFIAVNLGIRFLLELAMLVALGWVGGEIGSSWPVSVLLAIALPVLAAVVWGMFIAPKAPRRLTDPAKLAVELVLFAAAAMGLAIVGHLVLAAVLAVAFVINTAVLRPSHAEY
jgi:hypothetical protein